MNWGMFSRSVSVSGQEKGIEIDPHIDIRSQVVGIWAQKLIEVHIRIIHKCWLTRLAELIRQEPTFAGL